MKKNLDREFEKGKLSGWFYCLCANGNVYPVNINKKHNNSIFTIIKVLGPVGCSECYIIEETITKRGRFLEKIGIISKKFHRKTYDKSLKTNNSE